MCDDTYERSPLLFRLKTVVAENIDEFVAKQNTSTTYRLIGHGSYFQSKYLGEPLVRAIWDYNCDFDFFVVYPIKEILGKREMLLQESNKIVSEFHTWLHPLIAHLFTHAHSYNATVVQKTDFITVKFSVNNFHLIDFTLMFEDAFVEYKHPLEEISSAINTSAENWCRTKNIHRKTIIDYAKQQGILSEDPIIPLKRPIFSERNWIANVIAWVIANEKEKQTVLQTEINTLKTSHQEEITKLKTSNQEEITKIKADNNTEITKLTSSKKKIRTDNQKMKKEMQTLQSLIDQQKSQMEKFQQENDLLNNKITSFNAQIKQDNVKEMRERLDRNVNEFKKLSDERKKSDKETDELQKKYEKAQKESERLRCIVKDLRDEINITDKANVQLATDITVYKERVNEYEAKYHTAIKQRDERRENDRLESLLTQRVLFDNGVFYAKMEQMYKNAIYCSNHIDGQHREIHNNYEERLNKKVSCIDLDSDTRVDISCKTLVYDLSALLLEFLEKARCKFERKIIEIKIQEIAPRLRDCFIWDETSLDKQVTKFVVKTFDNCMGVLKTRCQQYIKEEHIQYRDDAMALGVQDQMENALRKATADCTRSYASAPVRCEVLIA